MNKKILYSIVYYGSDAALSWCAEQGRFIPSGMLLYITEFDVLADAMRAAHKVKKSCSGWADDIYINSRIKYY